MSYIQSTKLTGWTGSNPATNWPLYSKYLKSGFAKGGDKAVGVQYLHGATLLGSYAGGCLASNERIYMAPYGQANLTNTWHYIDTKTGLVGTYTNGSGTTPVANAYRGCVLDQNGFIYFLPAKQSDETNWHYLDMRDNDVVKTYAHGSTAVDNGYFGGVFVPELKRIYLAPSQQAPGNAWHYINTTVFGSPTVSGYSVTLGADQPVAGAYAGAVLAPNNRVYLVPLAQSDKLKWHYVDLATGNVVAYATGQTIVPNAYIGGTLAADGKIYLHPANCADQTNWHYIDTNTNTVVPYATGLVGMNASSYTGGVFAPDGKIYLCPSNPASLTTLHYIDTLTGTVGSYPYISGALSAQAYEGGVLARDNRIYFIPFGQYNKTQWHFTQTNANEKWSLNMHIGPVYSNQL